MPSSKFFKVTRRSDYKNKSYASRRIRMWIEQYNPEAHLNIELPEENEEDDELDWDDVGSCISRTSSFINDNHNKVISSYNTDVHDLSASVGKKNNPRKCGDFLRPQTPSAFHKPKKFNPLIISSENAVAVDNIRKVDLQSNARYYHQNNSIPIIYSQEECRNLNDSFDSESILNNCLENANKAFETIGSQIEELNSVCSNLTESYRSQVITPPLSVNQETQTECDNNFAVDAFPSRSYDENSVDPKLAFLDIKQFIMLIQQENQLLSGESDVEEFLNSQLLASETNLNIKVVAHLDYSIDKDVPQYMQKLQIGLNKIFEARHISDSQTSYQRSSLEITNDLVKLRIRQVFAKLDKDIKANKPLKVKVPRNAWSNLKYANGILTVKDKNESKLSTLRGRTNIVLYLMRKIFGLLMLNTQLTKRSIYYQLKSLLPIKKVSVQQVSNALNIVSCFLEVPPWHLNIMPTSKGLVYGDLTFIIGDTRIKCDSQNGTVIPTDLNNLREVHSSAYFILIVEKDTVFQKLMSDDLRNKMSRNFILITGKGYADMVTRRLLNILWKLLEIPMFIVVDADPHGIEIFLSYKFGSMNTSFLSSELALPKAKWLGVLPSELKEYNTKPIPLTPNDVKKLKSMLQRPYFANQQNEEIKNEITSLIFNKQKCEIEGIFKSNMFFANRYLPTKLYKGNFI